MGLASILVIVTGASSAGADASIPKTADAHALAQHIVGVSEGKVAFAHPLFGPDDLLVAVGGETAAEALATLSVLRSTATERFNYVTGTKSHVVIESFGRLLDRAAWLDRETIGAWIMIKIGRPILDNQLAQVLLENRAIKFVAAVYGEFDVFVFVETSSVEELQVVIDDFIRPLRYISATDTRITFARRPAG